MNRTSSALQVKRRPDKWVTDISAASFRAVRIARLWATGRAYVPTCRLKRTESGVRSWHTSPARAWAWTLVESTGAGNSYAAVGFDCDSREAVERAAASCMGAEGGPDSERPRFTDGDLTFSDFLSARSAGSPWRAGAGEATPLPGAGGRVLTW